MSQKHIVDMRLAALMIGIDRVTRAMLWRGLVRIASASDTAARRRIEAAPINW